MSRISGRRVALSLPRRFICDLLHASRRIPFVTFEREADLSRLIAARKRLANPPAWAVLIARAFARIAAERPEFRRTYVPLPWPHLWEADESVAAIAVEREYGGEPGVFFGLLKSPDRKPLVELAAQVEEWKHEPVEAVASFRRALRYARRPLLIRRLLWWLAVSWSGMLKARSFGTFGVSLTGGAGATAVNLIGPVTTSLNCGVIQPDGTMMLRLHFDHRVLDGMSAARALTALEETLNDEIVAELSQMRGQRPEVRGRRSEVRDQKSEVRK
jgi:pyruvate/2-oxoglutarate dehydrogenase complex dihydrolipoamide acyltransferase (E2) component